MSGSMEILCPACGSTFTGLWLIKANDLGTYPIRKCRSCRSAFVWPRPRQEEIGAFYKGSRYKSVSIEEFRELDQTYYPRASMDASRLTTRCLRLSNGLRLMDVGAGFGEFSKAAHDAGYDVTACEPNENSRRIFREINGFEPIPDMFDKELAARYRGRFDVALASHILEHVIDPAAFVADLGTILVPGGIVAVAVPHFGSLLSRLQGTKDMFICPPEHLNFFSRRGLIGLFERNGFREIALETVSKLNRATIRAAGGGALRGDWAWKGIYLAMRITDRIRLGTVLNVYLRKEIPQSRPAGSRQFPAPKGRGE